MKVFTVSEAEKLTPVSIGDYLITKITTTMLFVVSVLGDKISATNGSKVFKLNKSDINYVVQMY